MEIPVNPGMRLTSSCPSIARLPGRDISGTILLILGLPEFRGVLFALVLYICWLSAFASAISEVDVAFFADPGI